ncbi:AAA family ATPase [Thalassomonas viridans]|uniref:AAA family ATPase n=1 Tax=Thalassomonas viridans TaxID=137584 RepID=A0AAE9Z621_9GAMM|nr:AAA family ATPase [Thalassomonas viridans]WDE07263.1 AAA family ATPase [Thalassomonas viridans]
METATATHSRLSILNRYNVSQIMIVKDCAANGTPVSRTPIRKLIGNGIWPKPTVAAHLRESLNRLLQEAATPEEMEIMLKDAPVNNQVLVYKNVLDVLNKYDLSQTKATDELTQRGTKLAISTLNQILRHGNWPQTISKEQIQENMRQWLSQYATKEELETLWKSEVELTPYPEKKPKAKKATKSKPKLEFENLEPEMLSQKSMKHFKLTRHPFENDVRNEDDLFMSDQQVYIREAMVQASCNGSILAVIGESGAGKTELRKGYLEYIRRTESEMRVIEPLVINKKRLTAEMIFDAIADELQLTNIKTGLERRARQVNTALKNSVKAGYQHVLLIEEAHDLNKDALKYLKRIWELSDGFRNMVSIILIGQPELETKLSPSNYGIREFVNRCNVVKVLPLGNQLTDYLAHKFARCHVNYQSVITPDAISALQKRLQGTVSYGMNRGSTIQDMSYPLIVNNFIVKAMNLAESLQEPQITAELIDDLK